MKFRRYFLRPILTVLETLLMTQQEALDSIKVLEEKVGALGAIVGKIGTETTALLTNVSTLTASVADLTAKLAAGGADTAEIEAALTKVGNDLDAVNVQAKAVDDLVPDAPPPS